MRRLFREYQQDLGIDLCFQSFEAELASLPGRYAPPDGVLLLGYAGSDGDAVGCTAVRPLDAPAGTCELKRLFVRPSARSTGLGRMLLDAAVAFARERGYRAMRLDTLPAMERAIAMYRRAGFVDCEPYTNTPDGVFLELRLD